MKKLFIYLLLFLLFIFTWSSLASLTSSSFSSILIIGIYKSIFMQELFTKSYRSTYLFESSATSCNLLFIFYVTWVLYYFSRTLALFKIAWNMSYSSIYWHTFLEFSMVTISLVLIIEFPETNIRFLSWGPSAKFTTLLLEINLHAFSRC